MTSLRRLLAWLSPDKSRTDQGKAGQSGSGQGNASLRANAEKALRMKREAQAEELAHRPDTQTADEGMNPHGGTRYGDATRASEGSFTPGLKRAHVPRTGDGT